MNWEHEEPCPVLAAVVHDDGLASQNLKFADHWKMIGMMNDDESVLMLKEQKED